eukprot:TRINITY_DN11618_c0_g1_i1.p1 TRINITY_DN11618_c0_g1~~TRINITY_DN11618_c0_g1_i1.p1  ORF type:complete len:327 (-),score=76.15 TRINITY_DN11618_c0_g1_i1:44-1024(-)
MRLSICVLLLVLCTLAHADDGGAAAASSSLSRSDYATGNADFVAALDAALVRVFANGYDAIYAKWFSGSPRRVLTCEEDVSLFPFPPVKRNGKGTLARVVRTRHLKVGADFPFPPFEDFDSNGKVVGFEPDLVAAIAVELGKAYNPALGPFTWEFIQVPWDQALTQLNNGVYDLMANSITIASDYFGQRRVNVFDFTCGYLPDSPGILRGPLNWDTIHLTSYNDLNRADITIVYISNTPAATLIEGSQHILPLAHKIAVPDSSSQMLALFGDSTHAPTAHVAFEGSANLAYLAKTRLAANPNDHVAYLGEFGNINIDAIATRLDQY